VPNAAHLTDRVIQQLQVGVGNFGPRENVTCQTAATAAGGLGILFVSGFPAMYQVGLLSPLPSDDIGHLIGYMFAVAFYGMSFAIPLRAFFILRQRLVFPTPSATAYAIRSLHATGAAGAADAKRKGKWLFWTFLGCFIQKTVSTYIPGIIYDWHFFYWIAGWGAPKAQYLENWGWYLEITPAFLGAGILSGMNASWSFYGGSILAWGIIGPALVATGHAAGKNIQAAYDTELPYRNYYNMSPANPSGNATSPRYCLLWIGVLVMLVAAFVELACEWKTIGAGIAPGVLKIRNIFRKRSGKELLVGKVQPLYDPAPKKDQVPYWIWAPMSLVAVVITCVVLGVSFDVNVGLSLLGVILSVIFCFIGVLSAGATDINPVSTVAKATQLIFGGATKGKYTESIDPTTGWNLKAMRINLLAGMVAAGAAAQATDMTGDLKTGHLIGAKPIAQYFAQLVGAFCSIFLTVAFFILFTKASPCILDRDAETCQYSVPSAAAWYAVAIVVTTTGGLPIPKVSFAKCIKILRDVE
jgi:OPT family oligopeptide transporter